MPKKTNQTKSKCPLCIPHISCTCRSTSARECDQLALQAALAPNNAQSIRSLAVYYGVNLSSLTRWIKQGHVPNPSFKSQNLLTVAEEDEPVVCLDWFSQAAHPYTSRELWKCVNEMLARRGSNNQAGKNWVSHFLQRHLHDLWGKRAALLEMKCGTNGDPVAMKLFHENLSWSLQQFRSKGGPEFLVQITVPYLGYQPWWRTRCWENLELWWDRSVGRNEWDVRGYYWKEGKEILSDFMYVDWPNIIAKRIWMFVLEQSPEERTLPLLVPSQQKEGSVS